MKTKEEQKQINRIKKFENNLIEELQRNIIPEYRDNFNTIHSLLNDSKMERDIERVKETVENNDKIKMKCLRDEFIKTSKEYAE